MHNEESSVRVLRDSGFECSKQTYKDFNEWLISYPYSNIPRAVYRHYPEESGRSDILFHRMNDPEDREMFRKIASDLGLSYICNIRRHRDKITFERDGIMSLAPFDDTDHYYRSCVSD